MLRTIDLQSGDETRDSGWQAPPPPLPSVADYTAAIVALLDAKARERRYDGAMSISTYPGSTNPQWASEAMAFLSWRDHVWAYAYAELDKVMTKQRSQPTVAEIIAELPALSWPE
jgi:hypothetical protein